MILDSNLFLHGKATLRRPRCSLFAVKADVYLCISLVYAFCLRLRSLLFGI